MAEMAEEPEAGAPIARDAIDPDLIKLARTNVRIGIVTCLAIVVLCVYFILRFGGADDKAIVADAGDVAHGRIAPDTYLTVETQLLVAHAMRAGKTHADVGLRIVPARGTTDRLWIALSTDVSEKPMEGRYTGRLREFSDLPFAKALREQARAHPRPAFATAAAARAAFATGKLVSIAGDELTVADSDRVAFDIVVPDVSTVIASLNTRVPDAAAWQAAFATANLPVKVAKPLDRDAQLRQVRFDVPLSVAATTSALEAANLWATRVEPVNRHYETTWGELKKSGPGAFAVGKDMILDSVIPLVGLYVVRGIPDDAWVVIVGELPEDYWYVMPITVALSIIGVLFAWALARAVRRDLLPPRA